MICIFLMLVVRVFCIFGFLLLIKVKTHDADMLKSRVEPPIVQSDFNITDYFNRIEKAVCEILQEPKEKYELVLWWGLDGIRLNEDGTREWITQEKSMRHNVTINSNYMLLSPFDYTSCCNNRVNLCTNLQTQNAISTLNGNINMLQTQAVKWQQNAQLVNAIKYQNRIYNYTITQCCCKNLKH